MYSAVCWFLVCVLGPINFTMFLTLFGEKLNGTDPEDVIQNAFACFDQRNNGNDIVNEFAKHRMSTLKV